MENWSLITYYCAVTMLIIAYLLGSIPSAVWIGKKYYGIDIREYGSKNAGTTNMLRVLGRRAALPVFVLDFFKGFVAVSLIGFMRYDIDITSAWLINLKIMGVFAAVLGHIFPIFAGFKGGKGVLVCGGAILAVQPVVFLMLVVIFLIEFAITRIVSLGSIIIAAVYPILTLCFWAWHGASLFTLVFVGVCSAIMAAMVIYMHRSNIQRLRNGTEYRFGQKKKENDGQ